MSILVVFLLLVIHCVTASFLLFRPYGRLQGRKEYILPVLLIPVFGPLLVITVELLVGRLGSKPVELESLKFEHTLIWAANVKEQEEKEAIPLEEAILINDIPTRRKVVLKTFKDDPLKYLNVLMVARHNEDVDTTHYATIQISKIQRQYQLGLQKCAREYEQHPNDLDVLNKYIDLLGRYLDSGLPEENIWRHQSNVYAGLLEQKLSVVPNDQDTLIRKLRTLAALKENYPATVDVIALLQKNWPGDEQTWIESLRACVEWRDAERCRQTIDAMQHTRVSWTKRGREQVRPWVQV